MKETRAHPLRLTIVVGAAFFLLYFACGFTFFAQAPRVFRYLDTLFDADIPSRIMDMTHPQGEHDRTEFHPLLVLLLNPIGFGIRSALQAAGVAVVNADRLAGIVLCTVAGGATAACFHELLRRLGLSRTSGLLWVVLFGLSTSQLIFGSFPESFGFSALALTALFVLGTRAEPPRVRLLAVAVAAFGVVVTNIVAIVLVRARWLDPRKPAAALKSLVAFVAMLLAVTAGLSVLQHRIYPGTESLFQKPRLGTTDRQSFSWAQKIQDLARRGENLGANLVYFNLAAPHVEVQTGVIPPVSVDFPDPSFGALRPLGAVHALLWTLFLAAALTSAAGARVLREPLPLALALWIAFNVALHSVFGLSLFLYSAQWTFAVVAFVAVAVDRLTVQKPRLRPLAMVGLCALVIVQAVNNATFVAELLRIFARTR